MQGIRCIKRRLEKVIARINLEELKNGIGISINEINKGHMKKRKIVIKPAHLDVL